MLNLEPAEARHKPFGWHLCPCVGEAQGFLHVYTIVMKEVSEIGAYER